MQKLAVTAALLSLFTGCVVYSDGPAPPPHGSSAPPVFVNSPPSVYGADAGCYWDSTTGQDRWYFQASADDPDGVYDVVDMWAYVYDEWDGSLVQSFELYPTDDAYTWYTDYPAQSTGLDCWYSDYSVDFVAYDSYDDSDVMTVWANTY